MTVRERVRSWWVRLECRYCGHLPPIWRAQSFALGLMAVGASIVLPVAHAAVTFGLTGQALNEPRHAFALPIGSIRVWGLATVASGVLLLARWKVARISWGKKDSPLRCGGCGYCLLVDGASPHARCPECGQSFPTDGTREFWTAWHQASTQPRRMAGRAVTLLFLLAASALGGCVALAHDAMSLPSLIRWTCGACLAVFWVWAWAVALRGDVWQARSPYHWERQVTGCCTADSLGT